MRRLALSAAAALLLAAPAFAADKPPMAHVTGTVSSSNALAFARQIQGHAGQSIAVSLHIVDAGDAPQKGPRRYASDSLDGQFLLSVSDKREKAAFAIDIEGNMLTYAGDGWDLEGNFTVSRDGVEKGVVQLSMNPAEIDEKFDPDAYTLFEERVGTPPAKK